ncbi:PREDICTED: ras guanyl-releasing protein 3-like [Amphimedon queenslandica]|nr:PREDICTED: ras guanyl-releasing protein 3-like [Amphimedon queenslandica]XP_019860271.1 PREDICTED: ras guanyl-releasing protein 3-like [Amphimedon queenslandica]|eukprot:XP_003385782.2 PREDICTED: ras guanyl-releasing protein 3-like [Amphimedon queenslandica]
MTEDTPRIEECIRLFNGITTWVVCNILREYTILKRADIIEKFIDATKYLHELHGYNAMLAVVGGLNHFSVKRLQQTWSKVDKNKKDELEKWTNFFSMDFNYSTYRKQLQDLSADEFQQPALGILLKDLVAVNGQSKDYSDKSAGLISMSKYRKLWQQLSRLHQYQVTAPALTPDTERISVFRAAITQSEMTDDALDELSMIREPPVADGKGGSPTRKESKLPKFADWAQGNMPQLDADAVKKHVAKMVDSVFRVYDRDSSGYISIDEFQSISSNFPFIESFSVLDRDKDGVISRDEMMDYFLSANTSLRESFKHNFVEHTFIGTQYCQHCKGVLKGIVRQGVRCKDCGISCHKHCKDYVVVDCSKHTEKKKRARRYTAVASTSNGEYDVNDELSLKERLRRAESARDALSAENSELLGKLAEANAKIQQLNGYIATIRQHTIGFILEQMNTLQPQMDTPV